MSMVVVAAAAVVVVHVVDQTGADMDKQKKNSFVVDVFGAN